MRPSLLAVFALALASAGCSITPESIAAPFELETYECGVSAIKTLPGGGEKCAIVMVDNPVEGRWLMVAGDDPCTAPRTTCIELLPGQQAQEVGDLWADVGGSEVWGERTECDVTCADYGY